MNRKQALSIAALTLSAIASSVSAQTVPAEQWVGPAIAFTSSQSRAMVAADRNLWIRAGLAGTSDYAYKEPGYAQRVANYTRMRNGPEFVAEVSRIESRGAKTTAMNTFSEK